MTTDTPALINLLHRAGQIADERFTQKRGDATVTPRQQAVLAAILKLDEPSQTALVEATGVDRSTMADVVRRLTQQGLVARRRTRTDARRYAIRLTEKGEKAAKGAAATAEATSREVLDILPPRLRQAFVSGLEHLATHGA